MFESNNAVAIVIVIKHKKNHIVMYEFLNQNVKRNAKEFIYNENNFNKPFKIWNLHEK
jgi:hypothetical protein